ncbi:aromatic ring-opening dioxygenase LigA [Isoptericola sp. NEAU-Y5]|uniref:Aromatic ring-opening dioxygenase LigA n=1 Tax=Isoptericola luteus TaxID=2879484 RepID=A0ABS7ZJQ2_9MICO|nr:aromatic ring-opening dioxygenase LigA [Isoptericola sp. NEAU-Y5]MCA5894020.1 aromatic ring-opening dioxygenase LigA [Isoptericola sp. NEAU-Y5]
MTTTRSTHRPVRTIGALALVAGVAMIAAGGVTWATVSSQLDAQNITVAEDSSFLPGDTVDGPLSAFAQAQIIDKHALEATGGQTYAELGKDDPLRATAMNASFLRASLFTSVVAYGVAALVMGLGVLFGLIGWSLRRLGTEPAAATVAADTSTTAPARAEASGRLTPAV